MHPALPVYVASTESSDLSIPLPYKTSMLGITSGNTARDALLHPAHPTGDTWWVPCIQTLTAVVDCTSVTAKSTLTLTLQCGSTISWSAVQTIDPGVIETLHTYFGEDGMACIPISDGVAGKPPAMMPDRSTLPQTVPVLYASASAGLVLSLGASLRFATGSQVA